MPQYRRLKGPLLIKGNLFVTGTVTPSYTPVGGHMAEPAEAGSTTAMSGQVGSDVSVQPALVHPDAEAPTPHPAAAPAPAPHTPTHHTAPAPVPPKKK